MDSCACRSRLHLRFAGSMHTAVLGIWCATAALGVWLTNLPLLWSGRKHLTLLEEGRWKNPSQLPVLHKQSATGCAGIMLLVRSQGGKEQDWVHLLRHGSAFSLCRWRKRWSANPGSVKRMSSRLQFGSGKWKDLRGTGDKWQIIVWLDSSWQSRFEEHRGWGVSCSHWNLKVWWMSCSCVMWTPVSLLFLCSLYLFLLELRLGSKITAVVIQYGK